MLGLVFFDDIRAVNNFWFLLLLSLIEKPFQKLLVLAMSRALINYWKYKKLASKTNLLSALVLSKGIQLV